MTTLWKSRAGTLQLLFVIGVIGSALIVSALLKPEPTVTRAAQGVADLRVSVMRPDMTPFQPTISLNGVVESRAVTDIVPQVSGKILRVSENFRAGAEVEAGEILFVIDPADYELAAEQTLAEIEAARSELALLEAQSEAEQRIWDQKFPNRKIPDLTAKVPQIAAAKARIKSAIAGRKAAELALERTVVRTPDDARVLSTTLATGQVVGTANPVGRLFALDGLEIGVSLSTSELKRIGNPEASRVRIVTDGSNAASQAGAIVRTGASLDERTRLAKLFVVPDDRASLMLGEFVTVEIDGSQTSDAMRIPATALTSRDQVWVVSNGSTEERIVDVLGKAADQVIVDRFDVADGLIAIPPANVRAGLGVEIQNSDALAATPSER